MTRAIHQLVPVFAPGDAIGAAVIQTQAMLRRAGFRSEIFAEVIDQPLATRARSAELLEGALGVDDGLIYHLSIGSRVASLVTRCPGRRVLVYHNITPARYFSSSSSAIGYWVERGRRDLQMLAPDADLCIADSQYNLDEVVRAGAGRCVVIPPPIDLSRLHPAPAEPADPPVVLFVGRLAPNKRHDDLIRAIAALRATELPEARLVLVGGSWDTGPYVEALRSLARRLEVDDAVELAAARLSDDEVGQRYRRAAVYACASEHEGFCVPLIEAMAFSVPIVAYSAGAVPHTLGGAGVLVDNKDPLVWASLLARTIRDQSLRRWLVAAGLARLRGFEIPAIEVQLISALASVGLVA